MISVVITGATGFIGRHLLEHLSQDTDWKIDEIVCLTRRSIFPQVNDSRVRFVTVELDCLSDEAKGVLGRANYVFHLAANASVAAGESGLRDNITATKQIIDVLQQSTSLERLVFTSSIGAIDRQYAAPQMDPLHEQSPAYPQTLYGRSKLSCERLVEESGLPYTIVRPAWVYGPGMRENTHLVFLYKLARKKSALRWVGFPGKVSLSCVHSLVHFLSFTAQESACRNQIYFHSTSDPISIGDIVSNFHHALYGQPLWQVAFPYLPSWLPRFVARRLPLKVAVLLCDYLICDSSKAAKIAPDINLNVDAKQALRLLTRTLSREERRSERTKVLVTGAGSGIGRALCEILYFRGYDPVLVDRDFSLLEESDVLRQECLLWNFDLASASDCKRLCKEMLHSIPDLIGVINCAGQGIKTEFSVGDLDAQIGIISLNVQAVVTISHAALRCFEYTKSTPSFLVNISSSSTFQPLPYFAVYSATKSFVMQFTQSLLGELCDSDIQVLTIAPGGTSTRFQATAGVRTVDSERLLNSAYVAAAICDGIEKGKRGLLVIGLRAKLMECLGRILGSNWSSKLWRRLVMRMR